MIIFFKWLTTLTLLTFVLFGAAKLDDLWRLYRMRRKRIRIYRELDKELDQARDEEGRWLP